MGEKDGGGEEELVTGRKKRNEGGGEVQRVFFLVALSPDWSLLFTPLLPFTVLPAYYYPGPPVCYSRTGTILVLHSSMHRHTHTRHKSHWWTILHSHCSFESVRPSVSVGQTNKQILSLSVSLWVCVTGFSAHISYLWPPRGVKIPPCQQPIRPCLYILLFWSYKMHVPHWKLRNSIPSVQRKHLGFNGFFMSSGSWKCFCVFWVRSRRHNWFLLSFNCCFSMDWVHFNCFNYFIMYEVTLSPYHHYNPSGKICSSPTYTNNYWTQWTYGSLCYYSITVI